MKVTFPVLDRDTLEPVAFATYTGTLRSGRLRVHEVEGQSERAGQLRDIIAARQDLRSVAFKAPRGTRQRGWAGLYGTAAALARVAGAIRLVLGWDKVEWPPSAEG